MHLPSLSKLPNRMTMMTLAKLPIKLPPQLSSDRIAASHPAASQGSGTILCTDGMVGMHRCEERDDDKWKHIYSSHRW